MVHSQALKFLINGTEAIAKGELGHEISITTKGELGELASSFNEMSVALKQVRAKEACRVKQLTAINQVSQTVNFLSNSTGREMLAKIVSLTHKTGV